MPLLDQHGRPLPSRAEREALAAEQLVQDAWANPATGIGVWGEDKTKAATYLPVWRVLDQELTSLMNGNDIARKIVSKRPEEMFRRGFEIEGDDIDASANDDMREFATEHLDLENNLREGKRWGRLYGGALLLMGIDDGRMPWEPLDEDNIRDFYSLSLVDRRYSYVQSQYAAMGVSSQYGKANVYLISNAVAGYGWESFGAQKIKPKSARELTQQGAQVALVHESRVLRFDGNPADIVTRQNLAGWSWSVLQVVYDAMRQFDGSFDSVAYLLSDASQGVFKLQGLLKALTSGNRANLAMRLQLLEQSRSVMHGIALDAGEKDGRPSEDFTRVTTPLGGIADILDKMMARIACAADMPLTELFGRAPAGLNATGESDIRKWYDTIESEQKNALGPQIKRVFKLLGLAKKGPLRRADPVQWTIKFKPLWSPSDTEQSQARLADAQRDEIYMTAGCVKPEEVSLNLTDIYPNMDVKAREAALEGGTTFNPYENEPAPETSALISGKTEGEPLSPKTPAPLIGTSGTQITGGNLPAVAAAEGNNAASEEASAGAGGPSVKERPAAAGAAARSPAQAGMPDGKTPMQQGAAKEAETAQMKAGGGTNGKANGVNGAAKHKPVDQSVEARGAKHEQEADEALQGKAPGGGGKDAQPTNPDRGLDVFTQLLATAAQRTEKEDAWDALLERFDSIADRYIELHQDDWEEEKHPRAQGGKFGSGGGGESTKAGGGGHAAHAAAAKPKKSAVTRGKEWLASAHGHVQAFFKDKGARQQALSTAAHALRAAPKAAGQAAVEWVKGQVHEVKTAFVGVGHALSGQKVSKEEKQAIHKVAVKIAAHVAAGALVGVFPATILHGKVGEKLAEKVIDHVVDHVLKHLVGHVTGVHLDAAELAAAALDPEEWLGTRIAAGVADAIESFTPGDVKDMLTSIGSDHDDDGNERHEEPDDEPDEPKGGTGGGEGSLGEPTGSDKDTTGAAGEGESVAEDGKKRPRHPDGKWDEDSATKASRSAEEASEQAKSGVGAALHFHAARMHGMAALAHRDLAEQRTKEGRGAAAEAHNRQADRHQKSADTHHDVATRPVLDGGVLFGEAHTIVGRHVDAKLDWDENQPRAANGQFGEGAGDPRSAASYFSGDKGRLKRLHDFTDFGYAKLNEFQRDPVKFALTHGEKAADAQKDRAQAFLKDLREAPKAPGLTMRGVQLSPEALAKFKSGAELTARGFWSSTTDPKQAEGFAHQTSAGAVTKGSKDKATVLYITHKSGVALGAASSRPEEHEIIIPHGTRFRVDTVEHAGGVQHIHLTEL